ncbi:MAG: hypothetical protein P8174_07175 [Gemmatimonadota bacterium]
MRRTLPVLLLLLLAPALPCRAQALGACTYDTCSLRLERGSLFRGLSAKRVGADVLLQGPDSAAVWAKRFRVSRRRAGVYGLIDAVGTAAFVVLAYQQHLSDTATRDSYWAGTAAVPLWFFSLNREGRYREAASRSLDRSVWWYNRQFSNETVSPDMSMPPVAGPSPWDWSPVATGFVGGIIGYAVDHQASAAFTGSAVGASLGEVVALIKVLADRR